MIQVIASTTELDPVAEAASAEEALALLDDDGLEVDVAVLDLDMPGMNGLQLARRLLARKPPLPVVILTMHKNERLFNEAIDIGVTAYLLKDEAVRNIVAGITATAAGQPYVSPSLSEFILRRSSRTAAVHKQTDGFSSLTPTEITVLKLIAENLSSKEIAARLSVSPRTIGAHRNHISKKLNLTGKHPLLNFALTNKSAILSLGG